jgi:hypothetical protein
VRADEVAGDFLPGLSVEAFTPHPLHATERTWTETNCYVDVWIEVLHALGLEPLAVSAFALSGDFEGDQWSFFKFPPEDLRYQFGIEVAEMNIWRPLLDHVEEQIALGRLCTVECDAWFLPDTRGVSYRTEHTKTTVVPVRLDRGTRTLTYFHNAGYFELAGDDFDGVFRVGDHAAPASLAPYVESIRLDRVRRDGDGVVPGAVALTRQHLARRPPDNPIVRMAARIEADLPWLAGEDLETFHLYAFGLCRQCGASLELAAAFVAWLNRSDRPGTEQAAVAFQSVADGAKALQFALARVVRGRSIDLASVTEGMARGWAEGMAILEAGYGG